MNTTLVFMKKEFPRVERSKSAGGGKHFGGKTPLPNAHHHQPRGRPGGPAAAAAAAWIAAVQEPAVKWESDSDSDENN